MMRLYPAHVFSLLTGNLALSAALLSTPWATLENTDKDRTVPWISYESRWVVGVHFLTKPSSLAVALSAANYNVYSAEDLAYGASTSPTSVSYRSKIIFGTIRTSANYLQQMRFGYHAFLRLPYILQDNATYTVTVSASVFGAETRLSLPALNELSQLNTNIRVSQAGYLLNGPKIAFVGGWLGSATSEAPFVNVALDLPYGNATRFILRDAVSGAPAFEGLAQFQTPAVISNGSDASIELYTGQRLWLMDFTSLTSPGRYVVHVPGLGVSHAFRVGNDALVPLLGTLARGVYGQRCGTAMSASYIGPWAIARPEACHVTDAEVLSLEPPPTWFTNRYPVPNIDANTTTLPMNSSTGSYWLPQSPGGTPIKAVGGHHDAGDYGKYVINSGLFVGWLLAALEILGADQDNLPLPEGGDGVPDLFQEVEWELKYMEGLQDADGGVFCVVKPNTTAGEFYEQHLPCFAPGRDDCNFPADDARRGPRIAWPKDTVCTAQFAAAMARSARSPWFRKLRPNDAARYLTRARAAWDFLATHAPYGAICYHHYGCIGGMAAGDAVRPAWEKQYTCFDPQDDQSHDERLWAAVELYGATGEASYHNYFVSRHCPRYRHWGWQALPFSYGPATITYAELAVRARNGSAGALLVDAVMAQRCLNELAAVARSYMKDGNTNPYRLIGPLRSFMIFDYGWVFPSEPAIHLLLAATLAAANSSEASAWRELAAQQLYYMVGANPQGFSMITGFGERRIRNVVDDESQYDNLDPAWPGQIVGLAGSFSWVNAFGSAPGATAFPPYQAYPTMHRISDVFNVETEMVVINVAQTIGAVAAMLASGTSAQTPRPPPPTFTISLSTSSGPAPLTVRFTVDLQGDPDQMDSVEYDFGDGGHSYQAHPVHVYREPGRAFLGSVTLLDRSGQVSFHSFKVFTCWSAGELPSPPSLLQSEGLVLAARLATEVSDTAGALPSLRAATSLASGPDDVTASTASGNSSGGISTSSANLAWQGLSSSWVGTALRPQRFEDRVSYTVPYGPARDALLAGATGGLALEAWLYIESFLTYSRDNIPLLGLKLDRLFFGLTGTKWSGNQLMAGDAQVANDTLLAPLLTPGRWHHIRLLARPPTNSSSAGINGSCAAWVDGQLVAEVAGGGCNSQKVFRYCFLQQQQQQVQLPLQFLVGSFNGYVDAVRLYGNPTVTSLDPLCGPRPPPPPPPRPPPSPAPDNRFPPLTLDSTTLALLDSDAVCSLSGDPLASSLPLHLYSPTSTSNTPTLTTTITPASVTFSPGLSASLNGQLPTTLTNTTTLTPSSTTPTNTNNPDTEAGNTAWMTYPEGCSLRFGSVPATSGGAVVFWNIPTAALQAARTAAALSLEAKIFIDAWRTGYSHWNADVLGLYSNWDAFFKISYDLWKHASVMVRTPGASLGAVQLLNNTVLEAVLTPGSWHHVVLTANSSGCAVAVDGIELASLQQDCDAVRLLPSASAPQGRMTLSVGGVRGWVDELRLSSEWRRSRKPGDFTQPPPPPASLPPPPSPPPSPPPPTSLPPPPSPPPSPPSPRPPFPPPQCPSPPPPSPPAVPVAPAYDSTTLLLLEPDSRSCTAVQPLLLTSSSTALMAQLYTRGVASGVLAPSVVGSPIYLQTLGGGVNQPPAFRGHPAGSCVVALNHSACGSCANITFTLPASLLAAVKESGELAVDVKLWVSQWVNYGVDNSDPLLGINQAWDRYLKLVSDKWQMGRAVVKAPATVTTQQNLYNSGIFVNRTEFDSALTRGSWHHLALSVSGTACALMVDGTTVAAFVRCNTTAIFNTASSATLTVGGFRGYVADLRLSSSWRETQRLVPVT